MWFCISWKVSCCFCDIDEIVDVYEGDVMIRYWIAPRKMNKHIAKGVLFFVIFRVIFFYLLCYIRLGRVLYKYIRSETLIRCYLKWKNIFHFHENKENFMYSIMVTTYKYACCTVAQHFGVVTCIYIYVKSDKTGFDVYEI